MQKLTETPTQGADRAVTRRLAVALLLALPLAACGRKGPPDPPEGADPKAPRRYPTR